MNNHAGCNIAAKYSFCVEKGTPLNVYLLFADVNGDPIYIDHYDFSLMLKPNKSSTDVLHLWNTSESFYDDGIFKLTPFESGNFNFVLTDTFTENINYSEIYYNIQITSASTEDEILEGGIRFVTEMQ